MAALFFFRLFQNVFEYRELGVELGNVLFEKVRLRPFEGVGEARAFRERGRDGRFYSLE